MTTILFDFGGTIDTDGVHWSEKFWEYYGRFGVDVERDSFDRAFVRTEQFLAADAGLRCATFRQTLDRQFSLQFSLLGLNGQSVLLQRMIEACYAEVGATIARSNEVLEKLSHRYQLGLVSNFYGNLDVVCEEFSLVERFAVLVDSTMVGVRKPDPAIWSLALDRLNARPADTWVVGDSYDRDILPAKTLGCRTIWLTGRSWTTPTSTEAADRTIRSFHDIEAILSS